MGNQKQKWTAEEEEALLAGVAKHGPGKWKNILKDDEFAPFLTHRSNIDLKDKWRNLSVSTSGHGSKERTRGPKIRNIAAANVQNSAAYGHVKNSATHAHVQNSASHANVQNSASHANVQNSASHAHNSAPHAHNSAPHAHNSAPTVSVRPNASPDAVMNDASNSASDVKMGQRYNALIFEALSTLKDMNGSDIGAILNFMEQSHEVPIPPNFRKALGARLRKLIQQGKLERAQNGYKLKEDASLGTKTPMPTLKHKDGGPQQLQNSASMTSAETVQDAADVAAYKVVDAENKSFLAVEAMKEAERISKMAEDTESMLQLMKEIYEQCSRGEVVALA